MKEKVHPGGIRYYLQEEILPTSNIQLALFLHGRHQHSSAQELCGVRLLANIIDLGYEEDVVSKSNISP